MAQYFRGAFKVYVGTIGSNNLPNALRWVGNVPELSVGFDVEKEEHQEAYSGLNATDDSYETKVSCKFDIALEEFNAKNLALVQRGTVVSKTGASITNEVQPSGLVVGDVVRLKYGNVSAVTVIDSTGSPKTLTAGVNYSVNADHGSITILDLTTGGAYVQPLKVSYTYAAQTLVTSLSALAVPLWVRAEGVNARGGQKIVVEWYKVELPPAAEVPLIQQTGLAKWALSGNALAVDALGLDADLGPFGRVALL